LKPFSKGALPQNEKIYYVSRLWKTIGHNDSVDRTVWRTVDKSAETTSRETWFNCEVNIYFVKSVLLLTGAERR